MYEIQHCKRVKLFKSPKIEIYQNTKECSPHVNEWARSGQSENSNKWDIETVVQMFKVCVVFLRQVKLICAWANGCAFGGKETHTCFSLVR